MQSESARMSSAAEAKFRIDRPNSQPRAVKVIALDAPSERVVKELGGRAVAARELPHGIVILGRAARRRAVLDGRLAQRSRRPHQGPGR